MAVAVAAVAAVDIDPRVRLRPRLHLHRHLRPIPTPVRTRRRPPRPMGRLHPTDRLRPVGRGTFRSDSILICHVAVGRPLKLIDFMAGSAGV